MTGHKIAEAMASTWDEQGHQRPRNWHYVCTCGHHASGLKDQLAMFDAHAAHAREVAR